MENKSGTSKVSAYEATLLEMNLGEMRYESWVKKNSLYLKRFLLQNLRLEACRISQYGVILNVDWSGKDDLFANSNNILSPIRDAIEQPLLRQITDLKSQYRKLELDFEKLANKYEDLLHKVEYLQTQLNDKQCQ